MTTQITAAKETILSTERETSPGPSTVLNSLAFPFYVASIL